MKKEIQTNNSVVEVLKTSVMNPQGENFLREDEIYVELLDPELERLTLDAQIKEVIEGRGDVGLPDLENSRLIFDEMMSKDATIFKLKSRIEANKESGSYEDVIRDYKLLLEDAYKLSEDDVEIILLSCNELKFQGKAEIALKFLNELIDERGYESSALLAKRGDLNYASGFYQQAYNDYGKSKDIQPKEIWVHFSHYLAGKQIGVDQVEEVKDFYAISMLMQENLDLGKYEEVLSDYSWLIPRGYKAGAADCDNITLASANLRRMGKGQECYENLNKIFTGFFDRTPEILVEKGLVDYLAGNSKEMMFSFNQAVNEKSDAIASHREKYLKSGEEEIFQRILADHPASDEASLILRARLNSNLHQSYMQGGLEVLKNYQDLIKIGHKLDKTDIARILTTVSQMREGEAQLSGENAAANVVSFLDLMISKGYKSEEIYSENAFYKRDFLKDYKAAISDFSKAILLKPSKPNLRYERAVAAYSDDGDLAEISQDLEYEIEWCKKAKSSTKNALFLSAKVNAQSANSERLLKNYLEIKKEGYEFIENAVLDQEIARLQQVVLENKMKAEVEAKIAAEIADQELLKKSAEILLKYQSETFLDENAAIDITTATANLRRFGKSAEALQALNSLIDKDSGNKADLLKERGKLHYSLGNRAGMLADFDQAFAVSGETINSNKSDFSSSNDVTQLHDVLKENSSETDIETILFKATLAAQMNQGWVSLNEYNKLLELGYEFTPQDNSRIVGVCAGERNREVSRYDDGDVSDIVEFLDEVISKNPEAADFYYERAWWKKEQAKDFKAALPDFNKAIELNPLKLNAHHDRALANFESGSTDFAQINEDLEEDLRLSRAAKSSTRNALFLSLQLHEKLGDSEKLLSTYTEIAKDGYSFKKEWVEKMSPAVSYKRSSGSYQPAQADYERMVAASRDLSEKGEGLKAAKYLLVITKAYEGKREGEPNFDGHILYEERNRLHDDLDQKFEQYIAHENYEAALSISDYMIDVQERDKFSGKAIQEDYNKRIALNVALGNFEKAASEFCEVRAREVGEVLHVAEVKKYFEYVKEDILRNSGTAFATFVGTLAIVGVLMLGGIKGYEYYKEEVDKTKFLEDEDEAKDRIVNLARRSLRGFGAGAANANLDVLNTSQKEALMLLEPEQAAEIFKKIAEVDLKHGTKISDRDANEQITNNFVSEILVDVAEGPKKIDLKNLFVSCLTALQENKVVRDVTIRGLDGDRKLNSIYKAILQVGIWHREINQEKFAPALAIFAEETQQYLQNAYDRVRIERVVERPKPVFEVSEANRPVDGNEQVKEVAVMRGV